MTTDRQQRPGEKQKSGNLFAPIKEISVINSQTPEQWHRVVSLAGGYNFRDLGDYETLDERRVKKGQIFRSGNIANLTPADVDQLSRLGIKAVCDLRSGPERKASPNRWAEQGKFHYWSGKDSQSTGDPIPTLEKCIVSADQTRQVACAIYRIMPYEHADSLREIFRRLAAGNTPLVFHCAAGKDRTGIVSALILTALGVARETIMADYILTDAVIERTCAMFLADSRHNIATASPRETWFPILKADPLYLETMFKEIESRHGSVETYLAEEVGVDEPALTAIRNHLLE
jgi:protein-tyrosine phosphatase